MVVSNGKWVNSKGDALITPEDHGYFQDSLMRVKLFARDSRLTSTKIQVLFSILSTNDEVDSAITNILSMNNKQLKKLF